MAHENKKRLVGVAMAGSYRWEVKSCWGQKTVWRGKFCFQSLNLGPSHCLIINYSLPNLLVGCCPYISFQGMSLYILYYIILYCIVLYYSMLFTFFMPRVFLFSFECPNKRNYEYLKKKKYFTTCLLGFHFKKSP